VVFLGSFFDAVELEYRYVLLFSDDYLTSHQSFVSAVREHFGDIVLARNLSSRVSVIFVFIFLLSSFSYFYCASRE